MNSEPTPTPSPPGHEPAAPEGNGKDGHEYGPPFELSAAEFKGLVTAQEAKQVATAEFNLVLASILKAHGGDERSALHWVDASKRIARLRRVGPRVPAIYTAPRDVRRATKRKLGR